MPFSPVQEQALPVLDWLLDISDHHRRTGRTVVMAIALIRQAAKYPGHRVYFSDHSEIVGTSTGKRHAFMRDVILDLVQTDPQLAWGANFTAQHFTLNLTEAIDNWLPDLRGVPPTGLIQPKMVLARGPSLWDRVRDEE